MSKLQSKDMYITTQMTFCSDGITPLTKLGPGAFSLLNLINYDNWAIDKVKWSQNGRWVYLVLLHHSLHSTNVHYNH